MKSHRAILLFFLAALPLSAHPHTFLFTQATLQYDEGVLKGLWIQFEFDRFFSGEIIWSYDENGDGQFNAAETKELEEYVFSSFADFNYFTFVRIGKERIMPDRSEEFSAWTKGRESLFFRFFIPLEPFPQKDFYIAMYDSTFFCACRLNQENPEQPNREDYFRTAGTGIPPMEVMVETNEDFPVYYNPQGASTDMTTYEKWRPGLQTFIPEEIHVSIGN